MGQPKRSRSSVRKENRVLASAGVALIVAACWVVTGVAFGKIETQTSPTQRTSANASKNAVVYEPPYTPQEISNGKSVYLQRCNICHYSASTAQKIGPGLRGLYARKKFADGTIVNDAGVARWIEKGGKNMPGFQETIKPAQIRELLAYIRTL